MFGLGTKARSLPSTRDGQRIYAIGDVHGRYDLMYKLLKKIVNHCRPLDLSMKDVMILFLGDLVDRGPDSAKCLALLREFEGKQNVYALKGNHEDMMIAAIDGNEAAQKAWFANGGLATLKSYGIDLPGDDEDAMNLADRLSMGISQRDQRFVRSLKPYYQSGDYLFVHAGIRPNIALSKQDPRDLFSIREEFTKSAEMHDYIIVHGHSMVEYVEIRPNRISCDTGAYKTGRLSCVCLQDTLISILST